jgi:protein-L-isoaspartate(D-aspartate) O-methyltransferase
VKVYIKGGGAFPRFYKVKEMQQSFEHARENMVECQLRPNKVTDSGVLEAVRRVGREAFLPRHLQGIAYVDEDIALGGGRFMMEPMVLARLVQAAEIKPDDVVLDLGCGTGYSTAVLGHLAGTVVAIEADKTMAEEADKLLREMDVCNVAVIQQDKIAEGYAQQGPYNAILINGSVGHVPEKILGQLEDGGRLVAVLSNRGHMGSAVVIVRTGGSFSTRQLFDAATPALPGFEAPKSFVF